MTDDQYRGDIEFNDGLGDMLRERDRQQFSWRRVALGVTGIVALVLICFSLGFYAGKVVLMRSLKASVMLERNSRPAPSSQDLERHVAWLETQNQALIASDSSSNVQLTNSSGNVTAAGVSANVSVVVTKAMSQPPVKRSSTPLATPEVPAPIARPKMVAPPKVPVVVQRQEAIQNARPQVKAPIVKKPSGPMAYKVLAGSFSTQANADQVVQQLTRKRIPSFVTPYAGKDGKTYYRVQVAAFATIEQAREQAATVLRAANVEAYVVSQ